MSLRRIFRLKPEATTDPAMRSLVASAFRRKIQQAASNPVLTHVTGSPHNACSANVTARDRPPVSAPHKTHGMNATDHERFGALSDDTTGPANANTHAPSAAAASGTRRRRKANIPSAATGSGNATHKLNDTTSEGSSRIASVIGITNSLSASAIADWPLATNGSHQGHCPLKIVCRSQR